MPKSIVRAVPLSSLNSTALGAAYQSLNPNGLPEACFMVKITNGGTTAITVSYDGTTDHEQVLAGEPLQINAQQNAQPQSMLALFQKTQQFYVKGTAGMSGVITVSGYYV